MVFYKRRTLFKKSLWLTCRKDEQRDSAEMVTDYQNGRNKIRERPINIEADKI